MNVDGAAYGEAFADVYDEWYADVTDVAATVAFVERLAGAGGTVLELGVGTGRLAVPMASAGLTVTGIDASPAMLARLRARPGSASIEVVEGDMVTEMPDGRFDVVLVAYNTLFNLADESAQQACFLAVRDRLAAGGSFVVEAFVPDVTAPAGHDVTVRSMSADRVVLSVSDHRPDRQRTSGQFVELSESGGVRLRPWSIRWAAPAELDAMAARAGLGLVERWADMSRTPFGDGSDHHVSVYRPAAIS
jgi:SAM-dependent methyltransferase